MTGVFYSFLLYRLFNADGGLLYIGRTNNLRSRLDQHAANQSWWSSVARSEVESFPSFADLCEAEKAAIIAEQPRFNVVHNGRPVVIPEARPVFKDPRLVIHDDELYVIDGPVFQLHCTAFHPNGRRCRQSAGVSDLDRVVARVAGGLVEANRLMNFSADPVGAKRRFLTQRCETHDDVECVAVEPEWVPFDTGIHAKLVITPGDPVEVWRSLNKYIQSDVLVRSPELGLALEAAAARAAQREERADRVPEQALPLF